VKIFVDTNIFLDIVLKREKSQEALTVFKAVKNEVFKGIVADITIVNIDYVARKVEGNVSAYLEAIERSFIIVGADNRSIKEALALENRDLEDSIQYLLAIVNGCDCVVTNDKGFYRGEILTLNSSEFIEKFLK